MEKPKFNLEIQAEIKGISQVENNIGEVKDYALKLKNYYSELVFTDEQLGEAKNERAEINKIVKKVSDFRKDIIAEYKKPIELFENTAKETEKILKETSDFVDSQVKQYEETEKQAKRLEIETVFENKNDNELLNLDMIFDEKWLNKTVTMKAVESDIYTKLETIKEDLSAITGLKSEYETSLVNKYLATFNLSDVLKENTTLIELQKVKAKQQSDVELQKDLRQEQIINNAEQPDVTEELVTFVLELTMTLNQKQQLKEYMDLAKIKYTQVRD